MKDIADVLVNIVEVKKGDIYYMEKHDYLSGESGKSRPHIVVDVIDGYCGGALVMPLSSQYKPGCIPVITNILKNAVSYVIPCNMILIPISSIKKHVRSCEYLSTVDTRLCDGLKLIHMIKLLGYHPYEKDKVVLDYLATYIEACNNNRDKYTNIYGKPLHEIELETINEAKPVYNEAKLKRIECDMLTDSILAARIYKDCDEAMRDYVLTNVELYIGNNITLKELSKMLSLACSTISEKHSAIKKELKII